MAWKKDGDGRFVADESGNPIWVTDSTGEEKGLDYPALSKRLAEANAESKTRKEKLRELEARLAPLAEIEDVPAYLEKAAQAISLMETAPDRDKDVEAQIKARLEAAAQAHNAKYAALERKLADKEKAHAEVTQKLHSLTVTTDVQGSKLLAERVKPEDRQLIQRELLRAGQVNEEGVVVYCYDDGSVIYGESGPANADEAIISILKKLGIDPATKLMSQHGGSGSGGNPGARGGIGGAKNPWDKAHWNSTEQHRMTRENPELAAQLRKAAGF